MAMDVLVSYETMNGIEKEKIGDWLRKDENGTMFERTA